MTAQAQELWDSLDPAWHAAFDGAWQAFQADSFGIGAVLVDPATGQLVSTGRNRVGQAEAEPRTLSGNMTAHAEMNAFGALDRFNAEGLDLYTTLEPCLMCAATAMLLKVRRVHLAADDEYFEGLDALWAEHPVTAQRRPERVGPFVGDQAVLARFARLISMVFTLEHLPGGSSAGLARERHPAIVDIIDDLLGTGEIARLRAEPTPAAGLARLWDRL